MLLRHILDQTPLLFQFLSAHYSPLVSSVIFGVDTEHLRIMNFLSPFTTYYRVCNQINATGVTSGTGTVYPSGAPEVTPGFQWGSCYSIFSFICMFCRSQFVLLYFFFWPLCCLFFFDIRILIAPLVSSNSSFLHVTKDKVRPHYIMV